MKNKNCIAHVMNFVLRVVTYGAVIGIRFLSTKEIYFKIVGGPLLSKKHKK